MPIYSFQNVPVYSPTESWELHTLTVAGLTGLVGRNGAGKTRLLAHLKDDVSREAVVGYLPQTVEAGSDDMSVAAMLGIAPIVDASERLALGSGSDEDLALLEGCWDLPEKARILLDRLGLSEVLFDRPESTLSGGQRVMIRFAALVIREPDLLLLDEPTNNLDRESRSRLIQFLQEWKHPALIASHDRALLSVMKHIVEIEAGRLIHYGGGFDLYWQTREAAFSEAERIRQLAHRRLASIQKEAQVRRERAAKRAAIGNKQRASGSQPKVATDWKKNRAESNQGRSRVFEDARLESAKASLAQAQAMRGRPNEMALRLDAGGEPSGQRTVALEQISFTWPGALRPVFRNLTFFAPPGARISIEAGNGRGKSTLLNIIAGNLEPQEGTVYLPAQRAVLVDQHCREIDRGKTVLEQFAMVPGSTAQLRQNLAQFLFKGDILNRPAGSLSGGELLRLAFARAFIGPQAPVLLLLDEPTNHVDLETVGVLESALQSYAGTLIVASHDIYFKANLNLEAFYLS